MEPKIKRRMRIMKRTVAFSIILIVLLAGISRGFNQIYLKHNKVGIGRDQSLIGIQSEKENSIDVLVLGDSESYTTVSPMVLWKECGTTSYVCGQSGQQITETYFALKQALQTQKPKVLLLETNVLFRNQGKIERYLNVLDQIGMYYFSIFRYHNLWKQCLDHKGSEDPMNYKGFSIRENVKSYTGGSYMKHEKSKAEISKFVKCYVEQIQELCKENDIQLVMYSGPSPVNYNYKKHNALEAYTKEIGVPYLDFNMMTEEVPIDWKTDSADKGDHLNIAGAHKVSDYMAKYLKSNFELPNHKEDEEYQEWNDLEEQYNHKAGSILSKIRE